MIKELSITNILLILNPHSALNLAKIPALMHQSAEEAATETGQTGRVGNLLVSRSPKTGLMS